MAARTMCQQRCTNKFSSVLHSHLLGSYSQLISEERNSWDLPVLCSITGIKNDSELFLVILTGV